MFKYFKWKPALALLITRNALSQYPSKTCVLKSMPSRSHKAHELFVLPVQPVCLRSGFRGRAKRKAMCKNGDRGWRKTAFSGKWSLNFRAPVQHYNHIAIVHGVSGIWTCTLINVTANMHNQNTDTIVRGHRGQSVFQFAVRL